MSINQEVDALRRIPYFAAIEPARLKLLAFASERIALAPGGVLCRQGEPGDAAYIVLDGEAEIVATTEDGVEVQVAQLHGNVVIGEIALLRNSLRTATIKAATAMTVLRIGRDAFFQLIRDVPQLGLEVMRELAERVEDTTIRLRDATAKLKAAGLA